MKRRVLLGIIIGLVVGVAMPTVHAQLPPAVQIAINNLTTGVTPFTALRNVANAYINWGTTGGVNGYGFRDSAGTLQFKDSGGSWQNFVGGSGSGAPADATYWVRTANATLSNETVMGSLGTGLVINATTSGTPTIYAGVTCKNQVLTVLNASGAGTCAAVNLTSMITGTLPVANGGTGLTTGTSGGVLTFTGAGTLASSGALTVSRIVLGGGAGAVPTVLGSLGTATTVLHGNAAGAPTFGAVDLTADVTGILPSANGGTANAFFTVSGPTTTARTFTFPDANATILTTGTAITPAQGGTGITSYTVGDILYASGTTTLAKLADGSTGNALITGGVGVAPSYGKIGLTTHISGTLGATNGGTGIASYTTGDLLYASSGTTLAARAAVAAGSFLRSAGTGTAPVWSTLTIPNAATTGDILYASAANTMTALNDVAVGSVLVSGGVGTAPAWSVNPRVTTLLLGANLAFSSAAPTISSGFGTSPSVTAGTAAAFRVDVGTGGSATAGVIGMPTATTGWSCDVENITATTANVANARTVFLSSTTATATFENQTVSTGAALAWTASDVLSISCVAF